MHAVGIVERSIPVGAGDSAGGDEGALEVADGDGADAAHALPKRPTARRTRVSTRGMEPGRQRRPTGSAAGAIVARIVIPS
jgi:hypothetical protein